MAFHFQISARILSWPRKCACCGGAADSHFRAAALKTTGKRVQTTTTSWWEVPYCATCLMHKTSYELAAWWIWGGLVVGLVAWFFIGKSTSSNLTGFLVGLAIFGASFWPYQKAQAVARARMKPSCCTPTAAVRYLGWQGTFHTFIFESEEYTDEFISANGRKTRSDVRQI